ncbi:MAG: hypothetical protein H6822_01035 [Planctomycetaceae bacterium]|nr:hypothetical protein [Planctomycetales bacterium]MCB9920730.1 hypothetical protein [Planctomycetaceae bacterium]
MSEVRDKLSWLAFRYVANELDATEVSDFESQLLTDQAAREAVARVVEQSAMIHQALSRGAVATAPRHRSRWEKKSPAVALVALGSTLALLLAVCLVPTSQPLLDGVPGNSGAGRSVDSAQLALAWAESRHELIESKSVNSVALADSFDGVSSDSDYEHSLVPPSWMLAALGQMDSEIGPDFGVQE